VVMMSAVERQTVVAELDDVRWQMVEPRRPVRAQVLGGADHHAAVVKSLLVAVDGQQAGTRPGVGQYRVLTARCRVVDVPLLPQRAFSARSTLADEPVCRQDAVDQRHERRVDVYFVEPVFELTPADWVRREPPRTDDLVYAVTDDNISSIGSSPTERNFVVGLA